MVAIPGCPSEQITADIWESIELAALAEKGVLPVVGGSLDQTESFLRFWSEWRAALDAARETKRKVDPHG